MDHALIVMKAAEDVLAEEFTSVLLVHRITLTLSHVDIRTHWNSVFARAQKASNLINLAILALNTPAKMTVKLVLIHLYVRFAQQEKS